MPNIRRPIKYRAYNTMDAYIVNDGGIKSCLLKWEVSVMYAIEWGKNKEVNNMESIIYFCKLIHMYTYLLVGHWLVDLSWFLLSALYL